MFLPLRARLFHFNEYIKHFWQNKQELTCRFEAILCLWLGRLIFYDSKDTFSRQVIPWAIAIARGQVVPLASLFLRFFYHELDQLHTLEEQVTGSGSLKNFLCASFLQIFLWECIKDLKITSYPSGAVKSRYVIDSSSYLPKKFFLVCRWFGKIPAKKQDFLELLDDVISFVFRPYVLVLESFTSLMFFTDVACDDDPSVTSIPLSENLDFPSLTEKSLTMLAHSISFQGEENEERSAVYSYFQMRRQLGFDQGVPMSFLAEADTSFNNLFWSFVYAPPESFYLFEYITN